MEVNNFYRTLSKLTDSINLHQLLINSNFDGYVYFDIVAYIVA